MVMEVVDILGINGSLVELKDGALLTNDGRISRDGGETWSANPLPEGATQVYALARG